jgi:laminin, gamma 1
MLNSMLESKAMAESAVKDGDDTLKKANSTFHLLQRFTSEVQKSQQSAELALQEVPEIKKRIEEVNKIIKDTDEVCMIDNNFFTEILLFFL